MISFLTQPTVLLFWTNKSTWIGKIGGQRLSLLSHSFADLQSNSMIRAHQEEWEERCKVRKPKRPRTGLQDIFLDACQSHGSQHSPSYQMLPVTHFLPISTLVKCYNPRTSYSNSLDLFSSTFIISLAVNAFIKLNTK